MIDLVKKTMLAGVGLAVVTKDKVLESLDELVEKGKLTREEAAAMSEKIVEEGKVETEKAKTCLLYTSPSPRDRTRSRMPSSA